MEKIPDHIVIARLISKQLTGNITAEEMIQLEAWKQQHPEHEALWEKLTDSYYLHERVQRRRNSDREAAYDQLMKRVNKPRRSYLRYAAIALPLLVAGALCGYLLNRKTKVNVTPSATHTHMEMAKRQLATPKGKGAQLILPDGTKVWLGAASVLNYPGRFTEDVRQVSLSGEAYFEVSQDATHPFIVITGRSVIQVLGTAFNIKAYKGQRYERTTLVSGAVKVATGKDAGRLLKPGQQAVVTASSSSIMVQPADADAALAWKNGLFLFKSAPLNEILDELSRWYDVEIVSERKTEMAIHFTGRMARPEQVDDMLQFLETTGKVHFIRQGKVLRVFPGRRPN
ncbi:MAG TPA: FecR domain-containing protein [Chitinophaga sp.]|uniref:FecR family protein n=1 Tax=Chitinophaga sp. TaxID=1869181 RepID=UPI002C8ABE4C|nr:FecR domain-containing protein [Chitinophaga sp.]HVI46361.1 FecR domain-containing protein [Chitinophaga sp.]